MSPDPLIETIADAIARADSMSGQIEPTATAILAAIVATGRLLPDGAQARIEWSAEPSITPRFVTGPIESDREIVCPMRDPEQGMRDYLRGMRSRPTLVSRTVYTAPWAAGS